jgi:hypothetical protein
MIRSLPAGKRGRLSDVECAIFLRQLERREYLSARVHACIDEAR